MNRRNFLQKAALIPILSPVGFQSAIEGFSFNVISHPKITDVEIWKYSGQRKIDGLPWQSQVQPLHIYPEHQPTPYPQQEKGEPGLANYSANYLKIKTNGGLEGIYGPIDGPVVSVVDRQLKRFLIGKDPLQGERIWDQLYRLNRHARAGHFMMGISAIDNALWDLRGRYYEAPVYQLLGGPTREEAEVYGSTLGTSLEKDAMQSYARELQSKGFRNQKWFIPYGPGNGREGLLFNINMVKQLREAVGSEVNLMFDAFMGWDLNYALSWAESVETYQPRWIEEAFAPNKIDSFKQLKEQTTIPVATGEHFYNRWEVHNFLKEDALNVVQADPEWCGGVSELTKICHLASAHDVQVVPHGHNIHAALHVVASQSPMTCPLVEYLIGKMSHYYMFEKNQLFPENGKIKLTEKPGFGIAFNEDNIQKSERLI